MSDNHVQPIIIKKIIKKKHGHHGGSWKIAYADFVTAMMAFFLLMWLLSMLNKYQLEGISEYFKEPMKEKATQHNIQKLTKDEKLLINSNSTKNPNNMSGKSLQELYKIRGEMEKKIQKDPALSQYKNQLNFIISSNGLKIQLRELENQPMFSPGKSDFHKYADKILGWLANELKNMPNKVVIIGHTDSSPYGDSKEYTNWELSADRANETRRTLIENGMPTEKVIRVEGVADTQSLDEKNKLNSINRRIDIVVLTDEAAERIKNDKL